MFELAAAGSYRPRTLGLVIGFWSLALLPLLWLGFGSDVDAWLVGERALQMWTTHVYARSRSTGFPLYELAATPLVAIGGWVASNALSLASSVAACCALARLGSRRSLVHPLGAATAFLLLPVVVKNAVSTMDYLPALALLMWAYVALHERRFWLCACLIGIACGVRPTSGLFIIPACIAALIDRQPLSRVAGMVAVATAVGTLAFFPSLRLGGFGIGPVTTPLNGVLNGMRMFGIGQTPLLLLLLLWSVWRRWHTVTGRSERAFVWFHVANLLVWLLLFAALPGEAEYLMPAVLSVVLMFDRYATAGVSVVALIVACSFHVTGVEVEGSRGGLQRPHLRMARGLVIGDVADRRFKLWLREAADRAAPKLPLLFMEQILPPVVGNDAFVYEPALDVYARRDGLMLVSQPITDVAALGRLRGKGIRVVAWRAREWEYLEPAHRDAHDLVEFVDDPGALLGVPMRGWPADLPPPTP